MTGLVAAITDVWDSILTWIVGCVTDAQAIFVTDSGALTFMGILAVISVGVGLVFLVIGVIQNFLHLRS